MKIHVSSIIIFNDVISKLKTEIRQKPLYKDSRVGQGIHTVLFGHTFFIYILVKWQLIC